MLMPLIVCAFAAWVVASVLLTVGVRRAARRTQVVHHDGAFLQQLGREASLNTAAMDVLLAPRA